jgi:hypothetical protein
MKSREELIKRQHPKYLKASKKEKTQLINTVCETTGLSRDRASRLLRNGISKKVSNAKGKRGPKKKYGSDVSDILTKIWYYMDNACGKRMASGMRAMLEALIRFDEITVSDEVKDKLLEMSPATIDRLLMKEKQKFILKGKSTTKPGTLLKRDIPIRTGTEWDENTPGYVEIDLVAHCGTTTAGEYVNTLDVTDIYTGWTETEAIINKAQVHTFEALKRIRCKLPFKLRGIDSDNGSEFINQILFRYCGEEGITFTRSRPYRKNDNCYVEQKNWSLVRRNLGYNRYEGQEAVDLLNRFYDVLRLYTNFYLPSTKLISKTRDGAKVKKTYDKAKTPFQRVIDSGVLSPLEKRILDETYSTLNPAELMREMNRLRIEFSVISIKPYIGE